MYKRKVREVLGLNEPKTLNDKDETFKVLNRDYGDYVTMNSSKPLFRKTGIHLSVILTLDFE